MYEDLEGNTEIDLDPEALVEDSAPLEMTPFLPSSIAPLAVDVVAPLSMHDRSTSFSWPPPEPVRPSSAPIYVVAGLSLAGVLGLLVSFALTETAPTPATVVVPRSVEIMTSKSASFASSPAREALAH